MSEHTDLNVSAEINRALEAWRTRALDVILVVVLIVSLPAMISSVVNAVRGPELASRAWIYPLVFLIALGLTVLREIDVRWRGWGLMLLAYTNAIVSFTQLGLAGSGRLYIMWVPIAAVILIGARAGYLTAVLSLLIYTVFGMFAAQGMLDRWLDVVDNPVSTSFWIEAGTALAMLLVPAVVLLERFYRLGITTLEAERRASAELAQANARLEEYSQTLEQMVEQRTVELAQAMKELQDANRQFEEELTLAGQIQESFLPDAVPDIPGWQLAATLKPARETSGDFYDFISLPNGRVGIVVADVAGKGASAALYMALSCTLLRTFAPEYPSRPDQVLTAVNKRLLTDTHTSTFVTVFYGILELATGTLTYCNAGHGRPFLLDRVDRGKTQMLDSTGMALGVEAGTWRQDAVRLSPGDVLLVYSDGITEAQNRDGDFFGQKRLLRALTARPMHSAHAVQGDLISSVNEFVGDAPQYDDITLLVAIRDSVAA